MKRPFTPTIIFITFFLSACLGTQRPAPVTYYGADKGAGSSGIHNVLPGDTLWSISQRYNIAMQDLVVSNNLRAPFVLNAGQRITLPPPREYRVKAGDTLYSISRLFDVSTSEIAKRNSMYAPYTIQPGQKVLLPSTNRSHTAPSQMRVVMSSERNPSLSQTATSPQVQQKTTQRVSVPQTKITAKTPKRSSGKFHKPVSGKVISSYGPKKDGLHNDGINIAAPRGTPVVAAENGVVVYAGDALKGSGNLVLLRHDNGWMSAYAHLEKITVTRGQVMNRGTSLGTVGSTGSVDRPQLHFELRRGTNAVNPKRYIEG